MKRKLVSFKFLSLILFLTFLLVSGGFAQTVEDCLMCHVDESLTKEDSTGKEISLFVDESIFAQSVHKILSCTGCHLGVEADIHETPPGPVNCGSCHAEADELYQAGFHAQRRLEGVVDAPTCGGCHSYHSIRPADDPKADTYRGNQPKMCDRCHADIRLVSKYHIPAPTPSQAYMQSVHGKALEEGDLGVAVCTDCHRSHDLRPASDPTSYVYRTKIPSTCGQCHPTEEEEYSQDAHRECGEKRGDRRSDLHRLSLDTRNQIVVR